MEKKSKERIAGIDLFRILCCVGVLGYHTFDDILSVGGGKILWYACSFCVPGFFLIAGYLAGGRDSLTVEYSEKKILELIRKLFGWIVFWTVVHLFRTDELWNIWDNSIQAFVSGGIEPVAWFLFSYALILIIAPFLFQLKEKHYKVFAIGVIVYILILFSGKLEYIRARNLSIQVLGTYLYAGYFALGMLISSIAVRIKDKTAWKWCRSVLALLGLCAFSVAYYIIADKKSDVLFVPDQHYGTWYYTGWLVSLFVCVLQIRIVNPKALSVLQRLSKNTFTVYLGHLPILLYITWVMPLDSIVSAVLCMIILFTVTQIMAEIFNKLPLLRKIT